MLKTETFDALQSANTNTRWIACQMFRQCVIITDKSDPRPVVME